MENDESAIYLDTGIESLNNLLTRDPKKGIAIPTKDGFASSTTVIKGGAGVGKSVLAAIVAYNTLSTPIKRKSALYVPVPIYYSFSQPAQGIYRYLNKILSLSPKTGDYSPGSTSEKPGKTTKIGRYPLVVSPKPTFEISEIGGIATLRRALIEGLSLFRQNFPSGTGEAVDTDEPKRRYLDACKGVEAFFESEYWEPVADMKELVPLICSDYFQSSNNSKSPKDQDQKNFQNFLDHIRMPQEFPIKYEIVPFVIIDPINFFFDYRDSREVVAELFSTFRVLGWPVMVTLEDAMSDSKEEHRQLASYVEFEADLVVELAIKSNPHIRRTIEVTKSRNSQPRFGEQIYRIEPVKNHGFKNIYPGQGFIVIPSIHWFLSSCYKRTEDTTWAASTGIVELDQYFLRAKQPPSNSDPLKQGFPPPPRILPQDAFILVRGPKGGHKHPLAHNLLIAGLSREHGKSEETGPHGQGNRVLLISLGEETEDTSKGFPLAYFIDTPDIQEIPAPESRKMEDFNAPELFANANIFNGFGKSQKQKSRRKGPRGGEQQDEVNPPADEKDDVKITLKYWKPLWREGKEPKGTDGTEILTEAIFKPGYITPDEFLWVVKSLVEEDRPNRILIDNTAHFETRFPMLHEQLMLVPAICSFARSEGMMLIVIDVTDTGSNKKLSYGLSAAADFVIEMDPISKHEHRDPAMKIELKKVKDKIVEEGSDRMWAKLNVRNVRGQGHRRWVQAVTVSRLKVDKFDGEADSRPDRLLFCDITTASSPSLEPMRSKINGKAETVGPLMQSGGNHE